MNLTIFQCDKCLFLIESLPDRWGQSDYQCVNAMRIAENKRATAHYECRHYSATIPEKNL